MSEALKTVFYPLHQELGAQFTTFAGYDMPLRYPMGALDEHLHTRTAAGLFDVSHMGQIFLSAPDGVPAVMAALEALVPVDLLALKPGRQRYGLFTTPDGGVIDDLMVANLGDRVYMVVNAGCKAADMAHLQAHLQGVEFALHERALLALQGPKAVEALASLAPEVANMKFMDVREMTVGGADVIVARAGYTGEDGFEISLDNADAEAFARKLLAHEAVAPIGLVARDTLRLEAGLSLYGHELGLDMTPIESGIGWAINKARRAGGARQGGFPGAARILDEMANGAKRMLVAVTGETRAPVREGAQVFARAEGGEAIGHVTSGGFGPSLGGPCALALVDAGHDAERYYAEVRGRRLAMNRATLPFTPHNYAR
ncbi:MAG: glycine cleavage system aminomethyltransferase GcvT [Paracoccaceae bacterium]